MSNTAPNPSGYVHLIPSDFWREVVVDVAAYEVLLQNVWEGDLLRPQRRMQRSGFHYIDFFSIIGVGVDF